MLSMILRCHCCTLCSVSNNYAQRAAKESSPDLWKDDLVDDNVVGVNLKLCQLLDKSFCLIQRQELWYADTDKCCQLGVLELCIHLLNYFLQTRKTEDCILFRRCNISTDGYLSHTAQKHQTLAIF